MNQEISGDLENTRCPEIIKILSLGKRTGRLALNYGEEGGNIFFQDGKIIHAKCGTIEGPKAIYEMAVWASGSYRFFVDDVPDVHTVNQSIEEIQAETENRIRQMDRISSLIPSANVVFGLDPDLKEKEITLKSIQWRMLTKVNGSSSIAEIAQGAGLTESDAMKVFYTLVKLGVIKEVERSEGRKNKVSLKLPDTPFIGELKNGLTGAIGPIAPFIIVETAKEMGIDMLSDDMDQRAALIETIHSKIPDETMAMDFLNAMTNWLRAEG
jgi:hypothetical protein